MLKPTANSMLAVGFIFHKIMQYSRLLSQYLDWLGYYCHPQYLTKLGI